MTFLIFFLVIVAIHGVLFFFDAFFKSCMHHPYRLFLEGTGFTVKFLRLEWYTTALNRALVKWSSSSPRLLSRSFDLGVYSALFLLPVSLGALLWSFFSSWASPGVTEAAGVQMEILLPGVTLPLDEIHYYLFTLLISSVVHELGHAVAAVLEDVPLLGFSVRVYFFLPVALTELSSEQLAGLKAWRKLRVLCAGIWNNLALGLIGFLLLQGSRPLLGWLYHIDRGIYVAEIERKSPLLGAKGLNQGDFITKINSCDVRDLDSWHDCLLQALRRQPAYCLSSEFIHSHDESTPVGTVDGITQCCDPENLANVCFEYSGENDILEIPQHVCLPIRLTVENSYRYCQEDLKCNDRGQEGYCLKPLLQNSTTILELTRRGRRVVYMGHPGDIYRTVRVSSFIPKLRYISPAFGDALTLFLRYLVVFSFGLVLVNVIPCYGFDGQHIISVILGHQLAKFGVSSQTRDIVILLITSLCTCLQIALLTRFLWHVLV
ncbi:membrane-bound transcription factor site-2 protease [Phlebotomus argentipes]|uniref:membrane-bound transcription factor site-2 protease n=1 Tax=Phlebotomus argentipes TaxID=94469 RepID=UPI002892DC22|nr:membrane-bound transcription factor site-2 protease [Phlebotomus argentipes]